MLPAAREKAEEEAVPLAPYHLSVKTVSRGKGRSATAACAYRSGERIEDQRTGQVFDYSRRGGVERAQCEIFAPESAPAWAQDRQALWNAAEASEKRVNSVVAREFEIALPADLDDEERRALVRRFAGALVERHGLVVDASIHAPDHEARAGQGNRNHHAHVLCTTRRVGEQGFGEKTRELDDQRSGTVEEWRAGYAAMCGDALERAGFAEQAARWRSGHLDKAGQLGAARERGDEAFVAENQDRVPGKHYGPNVIQIERKGVVTERGDKAREPERMNAQIIDMAEARARIAAELADNGQVSTEQASTRPGLLDAARGDRRGMGLLDVPLLAAPRSPEIVLREWRAETDRQFGDVAAKAGRVAGYGRQLLARHERRQEDHRQRRPQQPSGLFAAAKRGTYEVAAKAWEATRAAIEKRIERLAGQIDRLAGYMRRAFPHEARPSPGELLAGRKAGQANPALATEARAATEQQERDRQLARQATHHHHHHQQEQDMTKEGTVDTLATGGAQRRVTEERARLERDGRLAARQDETLAAEATSPAKDAATAKERQGAQRPDAEQERRVKEARERIRAQRDKEREDRDRPRGRGR